MSIARDQDDGLPGGWIQCCLGEVAAVVGGGTPSTKDATNFPPGVYPWVTPADMARAPGPVIFSGSRGLSEKGLRASSAKLLPAGAVTFSTRAPIGYVAIAGTGAYG